MGGEKSPVSKLKGLKLILINASKRGKTDGNW